MTSPELSGPDLLRELRFALAEADSDTPPTGLRDRALSAAFAIRRPGRSVRPAEHISGVEVFRRAVTMMDQLLEELSQDEWSRPALRDLDVQGLIGHLIGVEHEFIAGLEHAEHADEPREPADHVGATQPMALAQAECSVEQTWSDWSECAHRAIALVDQRHDETTPVTWFGLKLPLEQLLIIRAFELWIHHEDIRRATGRPLFPPDPAMLTRMAALAVTLLPAGMVRAGYEPRGETVRLVLTGPGGGTWLVALDGSVSAPSLASTSSAARVVVDTAAFCRVVGNRDDLTGSGALVDGDLGLASDLFRGAATLALD